MIPQPSDLNRMALDEVGYSPQELAGEIRRQLASPTGYIDIDAVARALDIVEIKRETLTTFEGALLTNAERSWGSIVINASSGPLRGRFTVAHELLHFLNDRHVQTEHGFRCRVSDIGLRNELVTPGMSRHLRQEMEANQFAIELLGPRGDFEAYADSAHVRGLAAALKLSKEATARRYMELHEARIAMFFAQNGTVRYFDKSDDFPFLMVGKDTHLPPSVDAGCPAGTLTEMTEADPKDWLDGPINGKLWLQSLHQRDGYGITMPTLNPDDPEFSGPEDTFDRYTRWG